jgi:hypothetical protein
MADIDTLAQALRDAPAIEVLVAGEPWTCGGPHRAWLSVATDRHAFTCALSADDRVDCRAAPPTPDRSVGCTAWESAAAMTVPPELVGVVEAWRADPTVGVRTARVDGLPPVLELHEAQGDGRIAIRTPVGWRVSAPLQAEPRWGVREGFDASEIVGQSAWGVVTANHCGCGQLGGEERTLRFLAVGADSEELTMVASRPLGFTSHSRGWDGDHDAGVDLVALPEGEHGRFVVLTDHGDGHLGDHTAHLASLRGDFGLWRYDGRALVRAPHPRSTVK